MEMSKKLKTGIVIYALLCIIIFFNRNLLQINPLQKIEVDNPYMAVNSITDGGTVVVDQSGKRLLGVNKNSEVEFLLLGTRGSSGFYDARQVYAAEDGSLYVLDVRRTGSGRLEREQLLKYTKRGKFQKIVTEIDYEEDQLIYKNAINRITEWNGKTVWFQFTDTGFNMVSEDGIEESYLYDEAALNLVDFNVNPITQNISYLTKMGEIYSELDDGSFSLSYNIEEKEGYWIPWYIEYDSQGNMYVADIGQRALFKVTGVSTAIPVFADGKWTESENMISEGIRSNHIYYKFDLGERLAAIVEEGGVVLAERNGDVQYLTTFELSPGLRLRSLFTWICCLAVVFGSVVCLLYAIYYVFVSENQYLMVIAAMLGGTLLLTILFGMLIFKDWTGSMTQEMKERTANISGLAAELIPGESLKEINTIQDYDSEDYEKLRKSVRDIFVTTDPAMSDFYCVIYRMQDDMVTLTYSIEENIGAIYPYNWSGDEERELLNKKIQMTYDGLTTSEGSFIFTNSPILDAEGNAVGIIEVGTDMYEFQMNNRKMILNVVVSAVALAITLILIISELLIFFEGRKERQLLVPEKGKKAPLPVSMLRLLAFLIFFVTNMPKGFLPIYIMRLAENEAVFGLSPEMLISTAISAEVLFGAIFSILGNVVLRVLGRRKTALLGSVLFVGGLSLRAVIPTVLLFITGNAVMGAGGGLLLLLVQVLIAEKNEEEKTLGFTGYTAASLSGVNCGVVFGAFLINWMSHRSVLAVIGVLSLISLLLCFLYIHDADKNNEAQQEADMEQASGMSTLRFILCPKVILYFVGIVIPVVAGGCFLAYLYPILGEQLGVSETNIGYSYLINGICIICLGGILTRVVIRRFNKNGALLTSALLYAGAFIMYALYPGVPTLLLTLVLLGVSDSYGLPAQSTYFTDLEEVRQYGYDKAMGVYSLIENLSQVLGSFLFGIILIKGVKIGLIYAGMAIMAAAVLFFIFSPKKRGKAENA